MTQVFSIINAALKEHPLVERAYYCDSLIRQQIDGMQRTLRTVERVMEQQGVSADVARAILVESVRAPFEQYIAVEDARMKLARQMAEAIRIPEHVLIPGVIAVPEEDEPAG